MKRVASRKELPTIKESTSSTERRPSLLLLCWALILIALAILQPIRPAWAGSFERARDTFDRMPLKAKYELQMLLAASGYWPAVSSDEFGRKLYDAIESYEASVQLDDTRTISPQLFASLHRTADPLLNLWNMTPIDHRITGMRLWVPNGFGLRERDTRTGRDIGNDDDTVAVSYNFYAGADLPTIYGRLLTVPDVTVGYQVLRPEFFVVVSNNGSRNSYSRYQATPTGAIGFTFTWDTADWVHGERIATLMSDLFRSSVQLGLERTPPSRRSTEVASAPPDVAPTTPASAAPNALLAFSDVTPATAAPALTPPPAQDPQAAEQAREKEQQVREERFEHLAGDAKRLIEEASSFVKTDADDPHALDMVQAIADLNASLNDHDPDVTGKKLLGLSAMLQKNPAYARYEVQRAADLKRENARFLGDALTAAKAYKAFLVANVTQSPAAPTAATFLGFIRRIDALTAAPDLERAQALNTEIDLALRQAGLHNDFALATAPTDTGDRSASGKDAPAGAASATAVSSTTKSAVQLAATDKNRFLMEGDLGDVVLMYNTSPQAPHVVRNLRGDVVFEGDRADVCVVGSKANDGMQDIVRSALAPYRLKTLVQAPGGCDADHLPAYDVIATRRGTFLKQEMAFSLALAKALETDGFKQLASLTDAQVRAAVAADAVKATAIENDVAKGTRPGFGVVVLQTKSNAVCLTPSDRAEGHRRLLLANADKLATDLGDAPTLVATDLDGAFLNIKRAQCGAVYGAADDLKALSEGLKRDGVPYRFSALWFSPEEVKAADDGATAEKAAADKQDADRKRAVDEQAKIDALKADEASADRATRQRALRSTNGPAALAASALIAQDVKGFTDDPTRPQSAAQDKFPDFVGWYRRMLGDKWELMTEGSELEDYGVADWKGRGLAATLTRINLRFKNPILGDYKDTCVVLGQLQDTEFGVVRDPVTSECDDTQPVTAWRNAHDFRSRWNAE